LLKLCFVHPEARLRRLLLNHKEPAIRIVRRFAQRFGVTKSEAEKRDVRLQRASEKRMAFLRRVGRERQLAVFQYRRHRIDDRVWITSQQFAANQQHERAGAVGRIVTKFAIAPLSDRDDVLVLASSVSQNW